MRYSPSFAVKAGAGLYQGPSVINKEHCSDREEISLYHCEIAHITVLEIHLLNFSFAT